MIVLIAYRSDYSDRMHFAFAIYDGIHFRYPYDLDWEV